jgi:hypothetical protein
VLKPISGSIVDVGAKILHKRLDYIVLEGNDSDIDNPCEDLVEVVICIVGGKVSNMRIVRCGNACAQQMLIVMTECGKNKILYQERDSCMYSNPYQRPLV